MLSSRIFRTSSFRLTALYAGIFAVSVLVLFAVIYFASAGYMARQLDRSIAAELSVLEEEARISGAGQVAMIIAERQAETPRSGTVYLLEDARGAPLAGNVSMRRPVLGWFSLHGRRRVAEGEAPHRIRARGVRLDDGSYLVVGQDASQLDDLEALIVRAFGWSLAATLVLAILGGMVMSGSVLRRIRSVTRTTNAIMQGELSQRLEHRGVGDEFDQLAEALNAMLTKIEALVDGLKQISNDIAHDLRTPLSRLRQRLEMARSAETTVDGYKALIDRSTAEMDAILEIFSAMLRIADIEATTRRSGFARVDLAELLRTVVEVYEPSAAEKSQHVASEVAPDVTVYGDREMLTQLCANLLENAIKHAPPGSCIAVEANCVSGIVEVVFADSGPGIPEPERKNVFRRFYRLEASRSTPGSGLGLSLVAAIAGLHGVRMTLTDNHPGLRVVLRFPAYRGAEASGAVTPSA